jgi:hypothetical protein
MEPYNLLTPSVESETNIPGYFDSFAQAASAVSGSMLKPISTTLFPPLKIVAY